MRRLRALEQLLLFFVACAPTGACLQASAGTGGGATATGPSTGSASGSGSSVGIDCMAEPGGVTLCQALPSCPGVSVDPGALPNCGFRLDGSAALDLECACSGFLCPIGVPQSCADASQLLAGQTSLGVCEQASEGFCLAVGVDAGTGSTSSSTSSCDKACETECAGEPDCIQLCGC